MSSDLKEFAFGTCAFAKTSPDPLKEETKVINVIVGFDEGIRKLNKYKMSSKTGKRASLCISIHVEAKRITVSEGKL
ncbi:MAG: hypothetical protein R6X19_03340 [Kiritimatiellia bacterium]